MKKLLLTILLIVVFSINILSQIDFSAYPEISPDDLENYEYTIIFEYEDYNIILIEIEGKTYVVYY